MGLIARIRAFVIKEIVLVVAVVAALISCIFVPFDAAYASYVDWHTLGLLLCLMIVVTGLRFLGVMRLLGQWVVAHTHSQGMLAAALVGLTFLSSMLVTNDVALITFVPFALVVLHAANMKEHLGVVVTLMTIAANLGSMLFPMGNPQNLYLFQVSGMSFIEFVSLMMPYTLASAFLLVVALVFHIRRSKNALYEGEVCQGDIAQQGEAIHQRADDGHLKSERLEKTSSLKMLSLLDRIRAILYGVLFVVSIAAVVGLVDMPAVLAVVLLATLIMDARTLKRVDYSLLFTFIALFVFVGNMGRLPFIHEAVSCMVGWAPAVVGVLLSQVISNVPAAVLLSGFTDQTQALIVGANLGGLGTLIASMASVISFKLVTAGGLVKRSEYLRTFTAYNVAFLAVLVLLYGCMSMMH